MENIEFLIVLIGLINLRSIKKNLYEKRDHFFDLCKEMYERDKIEIDLENLEKIIVELIEKKDNISFPSNHTGLFHYMEQWSSFSALSPAIQSQICHYIFSLISNKELDIRGIKDELSLNYLIKDFRHRGNNYFYGLNDYPMDNKETIFYYQIVELLGYTDARNVLLYIKNVFHITNKNEGNIQNGKNNNDASKWYEMGCNAYCGINGVKQHINNSSDYFQTAYKLGHLDAGYFSAMLYFKNGNYGEAFKIFKTLYYSNEFKNSYHYSDTAYHLGVMYILSLGCPPNNQKHGEACLNEVIKREPDYKKRVESFYKYFYPKV